MASTMQAACKAAGIPCELVVNADNHEEVEEWAAIAAEAPGFVVPVFSANVHEARGYNRAARAAEGRFLVIWQDDQIPPKDSAWLHDMLKLFTAYPQLGILGMNTYRLCRQGESTNRFGPTAWEPDAKTGVRWTFAQSVDFAPFVVRKSAFEALGGLEEGFTRKGDCGIWGDWELCARAWLAGWQVGFMHLEGRSGDGHEGGTHVGASAEKCWGRQQYVSAASFDKRFGTPELQEETCNRVLQLNQETFTLADKAECPYGSKQTKFGSCKRARKSTWW